jgi:hypothetical protein
MMYLADARALEWFAHVRYARRIRKGFYQNRGLYVLQPLSSPITHSMISSVRQEILSLAGCVKITFMGSSRPGRSTNSAALCVHTVPELQMLLSLLLHETPSPPSRKASDYAFAPCILLIADFFSRAATAPAWQVAARKAALPAIQHGLDHCARVCTRVGLLLPPAHVSSMGTAHFPYRSYRRGWSQLGKLHGWSEDP